MFSCEFCEISQNTFIFTEYIWATASEGMKFNFFLQNIFANIVFHGKEAN